MINRNLTRTILNATETTEKTKTIASDSLSLAMTTVDYLYLGYKQPFGTRYFYFKTPNTNPCTLKVEYWDGSVWRQVEDLADETNGFTKNGFISWLNFGVWMYKQEAPIAAVNSFNKLQFDLSYFWVRISVSADLSAGTELQSVLNLFCDDALFGIYYPELLNDSRYLPANRTDFMEQYWAAKEHVVRRMRQMGKIKDEGEIIDVVDVAVAAVHATAYIILNPIARDEETRTAAKSALKACEDELARATQSVDTNEDGKLTQDEKFTGTSFFYR